MSIPPYFISPTTEAKTKEKHGVWDPMPELVITSPYALIYIYIYFSHLGSTNFLVDIWMAKKKDGCLS
jgi:hypothetical protein